MNKVNVLFLCIHNSARSQMAEAFLKHMAGDKFEVESAGLEAGTLNPLAVEAMKEIGIDISHHKTKEVFDFFKQGKQFHTVVTVCDEASSESCPFFPTQKEKINWNLPDPANFIGPHDQKMQLMRIIRDVIKDNVTRFVLERE